MKGTSRTIGFPCAVGLVYAALLAAASSPSLAKPVHAGWWGWTDMRQGECVDRARRGIAAASDDLGFADPFAVATHDGWYVSGDSPNVVALIHCAADEESDRLVSSRADRLLINVLVIGDPRYDDTAAELRDYLRDFMRRGGAPGAMPPPSGITGPAPDVAGGPGAQPAGGAGDYLQYFSLDAGKKWRSGRRPEELRRGFETANANLCAQQCWESPLCASFMYNRSQVCYLFTEKTTELTVMPSWDYYERREAGSPALRRAPATGGGTSCTKVLENVRTPNPKPPNYTYSTAIYRGATLEDCEATCRTSTGYSGDFLCESFLFDGKSCIVTNSNLEDYRGKYALRRGNYEYWECD